MWFNEYEKHSVRRNIGSSRPQIGGCPMPSWFSASLINQARGLTGSSKRSNSIVSQQETRFPSSNTAAAGSEEQESEYEEIEHAPVGYANMNQNPTNSRHPSSSGQNVCALCGNLNPLVRCEMCNDQSFCGACNDMFHRHPKRHNHTRKLLEPMETRPPLPGSKVHPLFHSPVAPPRRNKKLGFRSTNVSPTPTTSRFQFDPVGSLRRSGGPMVQRPLPTPPLHVRMEQQFGFQSSQNRSIDNGMSSRLGRNFGQSHHQTVDRRQSAPYAPSNTANFAHRSGSIANPGFALRNNVQQHGDSGSHSSIPLTVMELGNRRPHPHQDISKLSAEKYCLPPSRDSGWDEDEEDVLPRNQRAFSVSASNLQQFPTSASDASHFATLQRRGNSKPPARPPPPVPPRDFSHAPPQSPSQRQMYPASSAFELDRAGAFVPWVNPGQGQHFNNRGHGPPVGQSARGWSQAPMATSEINLEETSVGGKSRARTYGNQKEMFCSSKSPEPFRKPPQLEPEYYSGDEGEEDDDPVELPSLTENPEGPWSCEHCTFINPKSTKVCTVCCKTPVTGYRVVLSRQSVPMPKQRGTRRDVDVDLDGFVENELSPVVQSKLSFSTAKSRQSPQKINLSVEKVRKVKPSRQVAVAADESEDGSESESSSAEDQTTRHRPPVPEKGRAVGNENSHPRAQRAQSVSESHPPTTSYPKQKQIQTVECGTGDYSILEPKLTQGESKAKKNIQEEASKSKPPVEPKSSKGTSPPPQTISTQTYEELPAHSRVRQESVSKSSVQSSSIQSRESSPPPPPRVVEMSDKALRYERRAHQHSQLKRSMSAHLHSSGGGSSSDAWTGQGHSQQHHEGRHLYRTSSRQSLASDTRSLPISGPPSRDTSPGPGPSRGRYNDELRRFGPMPPWDRYPSPADYFASIEDLVTRKRRESAKSQEFELSRLLKEAEELNYTPEDLQVGLRMCGGDRNPLKWLEDNWTNMVETVQTLATKFGRDKGQEYNEVGTISPPEAKDALRLHKGNVWAAVTECVERRRKKFLELQSRGTFLREDILTALTANQGSLDAAYVELSKNQLKPFLMRIWGPPIGKDNESIPPPRPQTPTYPPKIEGEADCPRKSFSGKESADGKENARRDGGVPNSMELSPEINEPKVTSSPDSEEVLMKTDGEKDIFYDLELESVGRSQSISDGELEDSEAHVSAFIQNYEVPPPPPSPIIPERLIFPLSMTDSKEDGIPIPSIMGSHKGETTGNDSPKSPLLVLDGQRKDLEMDMVTAPETLASLTKAVSVIAGQLGVLLKQQQSLASATEPEMDSTNEKIINGESQDPTTFPLLLTENDADALRNIYSEDLKVLKELVLTEKEEVSHENLPTPTFIREKATTVQGQRAGEKVGPLGLTTTKSTASKIYEVLGNLAGSLLGGGSKSKKSQADENLYETVSVSGTGSLEVINRNKTLADMLDEKIDTNRIQIETKNDSPQPPPLPRLERKEYFDISHLRSPLLALKSGTALSGSEKIETSWKNQSPTFDSFDEMKFEDYSGSESGESEGEEEILWIDRGNDEDEEQLDQIKSPGSVAHFVPEIPSSSSNSPIEKPRDDAGLVEFGATKVGPSALLTSGRVDSIEKAQIAFKLMDMNFSEEDSIHAANECSTLYTAISFLQQECFLCAGKFSAKQMISMLRCKHSCCRTCAAEYFLVQIRDHSIIEATCPFCKEPSNLNEDSDQASDYFSHLEILLRDLLNDHFYEMFGRKLRDWTLAKTPNFKWCSKCSSGFITEPLQTHLICPDCNCVTCAICLEPWDKFNHEHRDRNRTQVFCDENTGAGGMSKSIVETLNENSVECPQCHLKFALARGGCMHLTCSQCRYEFCSGCSAPFAMGLRCKNNASFCAKLGLHAHHPRNCLFYLRDKEPDLLKKLLSESEVKFVENAESPEKPLERPIGKCVVALQKETLEGLLDDICGQEVTKESSDVCQTHYVEYLGLLVWENRLDPIPILSNDDLETIVKRACKKMPPRSYGTTDAEYRPLLLQVIEDEIPL